MTKRRIEVYEQTNELDIKRTLIESIPWLIFFVVWLIFSFKGLNIVSVIEDKTLQVFGLFGVFFLIIKFFGMIGFPELRFKMRFKGYKYE